MNSRWSLLRDSIKPSASFREKLKAGILDETLRNDIELFSKISKSIIIPEPHQKLIIQKKVSSKNTFFLSFQKKIQIFIKSAFLKWCIILGGATFASVLFFPIVIPFFSPPTQAMNETIIRGVEGSVALTRNGISTIVANNGNILDKDILITGENASAEIVFFDGSIIRVAPNSKLVFDEITPHPFLLSSGGISVLLESGEIWMKTFSVYSENSQISVQTADLTVLPSQSSFRMKYENGVDQLQVWSNTVTVIIKGLNIEDSLLVRKNESFQFSPFDKTLPSVQYLMEKDDFVNKNIEQDVLYTKEFLKRVTAQMKEEYILSSLSSQIHSFLENNDDPESVEYLISEINNLILVARNKDIDPQPSPEDKSIETSEYLPLKKNTNKKVISSQKIIHSSYSPSSNSSGDQVFPVDSLTDTQKTATELAKAYQEYQKTIYQEKVSKSFVEQVNQFSFLSSRQTKAKTLLNNIPDGEDSLILLQKIEQIAPDDIKEEVIEKKKNIEKKIFKNAPSKEDVSLKINE